MSTPTPPPPAAPKTPDQIVAEKIIAALAKDGLLRKAQEAKFSGKLAAGKVTAEDWALEVELALAPKPAAP